ncbi:MAG TPA: hypothetical protein PKV43_06185, partial [Armatimonadota bacterium]|nr:hypothetical protein [Armatimonadota bacterium]
LYFFLEFAVPPTIPWKTTSGVVVSKPGDKQLQINRVRKTASATITEQTIVKRVPSGGGTPEPVPSDAVKPGDRVVITTETGREISGIVMPRSSPRRIFVGTLTPNSEQVSIDANMLIRRLRSGGSAEEVKLDALEIPQNTSGSLDWINVGPTTYLSSYLTKVTDFFIVLGAMAWGMGLLSLWLVHSSNIRKRRPEWYTSVFFFIAVGFGIIAGLGFGRTSPGVKYTWDWWTYQINDVVFWQMIRPMGSTIFSLLTFYLASAAYRSFKAKSREAILMMLSALIVMLGQISLHMWITSASTWLLYIVNTAAIRGMMFGMMLGGIAVGLRMWLSLERGAFFDREL